MPEPPICSPRGLAGCLAPTDAGWMKEQDGGDGGGGSAYASAQSTVAAVNCGNHPPDMGAVTCQYLGTQVL